MVANSYNGEKLKTATTFLVGKNHAIDKHKRKYRINVLATKRFYIAYRNG